jgi:hypothetical protein
MARDSKRVSLSKNQQATFLISNLSPSSRLDFSLVLEFPIEFPADAFKIFRVFSPESGQDVLKGTLDAGKSLLIAVELLNSMTGAFSDNVKLVITDLNSIRRHSHIIQLEMIEEALEFNPITTFPSSTEINTSSLALGDLLLDLSSNRSSPISEASNPAAATFLLKGCKRLSECGLYELDLGKLDLLSATPTRKVVLEGQSGPCSYGIRTISPENDKNWIVPSRYDGVLESGSSRYVSTTPGAGRDSHTIIISFMTGIRGVYSTYLIIENLQNPADTKTIRVTMEGLFDVVYFLVVVVKQNIKRSAVAKQPTVQETAESAQIFDVHLSGADSVDCSEVVMNSFYWSPSVTRSFFIFNRESVPLEIVVKPKMPVDDQSELVFSLSKNHAKLLRMLRIAPFGRSRVYIHFTAIPDYENGGSPDDLVGKSNGESIMLAESGEKVHETNYEISVNCRLVCAD